MWWGLPLANINRVIKKHDHEGHSLAEARGDSAWFFMGGERCRILL